VRDNAGTWQYNSQETVAGYADINNITGVEKTYAGNNFSFTPFGGYIKPDGTKFYLTGWGSRSVYEYNLSTAFDISTMSLNNTYTPSTSHGDYINNAWFKSDGTVMYTSDYLNQGFRQHSLSTAWDISTATMGSFVAASPVDYTRTIMLKPDGTKMYYLLDNDIIYQFSLSTAHDITTATYDNKSFSLASQSTTNYTFYISDDGYKLYTGTQGTNHPLYQYSLSTAWDISTASYDSISYSLPSGAIAYGITFGNSGQKLYVTESSSGDITQYNTGTTSYSTLATWTDATTNDEFYALQQALGATSVNRMDKAQLDAVADGSHFTLGDTLDLMIALKQDTASASLPTSDGVSINYDAQALNQGAVLGTDYDYDFPNSTTVRITSNAAQNLKIRVV